MYIAGGKGGEPSHKLPWIGLYQAWLELEQQLR